MSSQPSRTLLLVFHRDLTKSKANAALIAAARDIPGVEVVDMQARYPDDRIDVMGDTDDCVAQLLSADRIVFQFPVQWYSVPSIMKAWLDAILTRMYYIRHAEEGARLEGTPLMIGATAGNVPEAYTPEGQNHFPMIEILTPLRATAWRCRLPLAEPFVLYRADKLPPADLAEAAKGYAAALTAWIAATPAPPRDADPTPAPQDAVPAG